MDRAKTIDNIMYAYAEQEKSRQALFLARDTMEEPASFVWVAFFAPFFPISQSGYVMVRGGENFNA